MFGVACDVTSGESVEAAFAVEEQYGPVEVLVSNAGVTNDGLLLRMSEDDFTSVIDANLTAAHRAAVATQGMLRARKGRMIFMSSWLLGSAGQANYAASKAGLVGLARSLARGSWCRNTVNVVAPGPIDTDMTQALPDKRQAELSAAVPLGRSAAPTRSPPLSSSWPRSGRDITGAVIPVDGGLGMGH